MRKKGGHVRQYLHTYQCSHTHTYITHTYRWLGKPCGRMKEGHTHPHPHTHTHTCLSSQFTGAGEIGGGGVEAQELEMRRYFLTSNVDGCVLGLDHDSRIPQPSPRSPSPTRLLPRRSSTGRDSQAQRVTGLHRCPPSSLLSITFGVGSVACKPL